MARRKEGVLITSAILRRTGACQGYCRMFRKRYPKGLRITQAEAERLANSRLFRGYLEAAAKRLLTEAGNNIWLERYRELSVTMGKSSWPGPRSHGISFAARRVALASVLADLLLDPDYRNPLVY